MSLSWFFHGLYSDKRFSLRYYASNVLMGSIAYVMGFVKQPEASRSESCSNEKEQEHLAFTWGNAYRFIGDATRLLIDYNLVI